jgi:hypothetical protein
METITLYRPVGPEEISLIRQSGFKRFPPRLPGQPIFYPVLNKEYATQIARDWNAKNSGSGYVARFQVNASFLSTYDVRTVGSGIHKEYWIPAEHLSQFNENIVGDIEVIAEYHRE